MTAVRSRRALVWAVGAFVFAQVALTAALERPASWLRDPEYAAHRERFLRRNREFPGRASVVVFGSSRVVVGLRPGEPAAGEPLVINFGHVGGGPFHQLLALRRLLADGPKPDAAFVEFWPPFAVDTPLEDEGNRVLPSRLRGTDLGVFHGRFDADWRAARLTPGYGHRFFLMSQWVPVWLAAGQRYDSLWGLAGQGDWTCGEWIDPERRARLVATTRTTFRQRLAAPAIRPSSARAFDEVFADCRAAGVRAALVWLPESSEFRACYPPATEAAAYAFAADLTRRHGVPFLDARSWQPDGDFPDGYHLDRDGAARFTERFRREAVPLVAGTKRP